MNLKEMYDNSCLLAYQISTDPNPLQVSPSGGNPSYAALTIVVSNNNGINIYCNQITFFIPVGPLAPNLTNNAVGILVAASPDKWQISNNNDGSFTATPKKPIHSLIEDKDGLVFQIYNVQVNEQVGEFTFSVRETSSNDNTNFSDKDNDYKLAKFPYGFFMKNFTASSPLVSRGNTVTLTWIASDLAKYTLFCADKYFELKETRSFTSPPLNNITTFILKGTVQYLGETVNNYLSTTVVVANPEITATSLNVLQKSNLNGDTTIGTDSTLASLFVKGNVDIGRSLVVQTSGANEELVSFKDSNSITKWHINQKFETLSHKHGLNFVETGVGDGRLYIQEGGNVGIGTVDPSARLEVNGDTKITGSLTVQNDANISSLKVTGSVSLMQPPQAIPIGNSFLAPTDGFLIGNVESGDPNNIVTIWAKNSYITCGTTSFLYANNSIVLPVGKGDTCSTGLTVRRYAKDDIPVASVSFWWIPLGSNSPVILLDLQDTSINLRDEQMCIDALVPKKAVDDMVKVVDNLFGNSLTKEQKDEFNIALKKLFDVSNCLKRRIKC